MFERYISAQPYYIYVLASVRGELAEDVFLDLKSLAQAAAQP